MRGEEWGKGEGDEGQSTRRRLHVSHTRQILRRPLVMASRIGFGVFIGNGSARSKEVMVGSYEKGRSGGVWGREEGGGRLEQSERLGVAWRCSTNDVALLVQRTLL